MFSSFLSDPVDIFTVFHFCCRSYSLYCYRHLFSWRLWLQALLFLNIGFLERGGGNLIKTWRSKHRGDGARRFGPMIKKLEGEVCDFCSMIGEEL